MFLKNILLQNHVNLRLICDYDYDFRFPDQGDYGIWLVYGNKLDFRITKEKPLYQQQQSGKLDTQV